MGPEDHNADLTAGQGDAQGSAQADAQARDAQVSGPQGAARLRPAAFIFDVFGTCVDWRSGVALVLRDALAAKGVAVDPAMLTDAWRNAYQPSMQRIIDGGRGYVPLDELHRENLERVLADHGLAGIFDAGEIATLARAWEQLPPWPDVHQGVRRLKKLAPIAPCSNGSIALMVHLARFADLPWDCILGAEIARDFKPAPGVYLAACAALRLDPAQVLMVACHADDLDAAKAAGLRTAYIPRPMEWGEAHTHDVLTPEAARARFDFAAHDFAALADTLGG
ncbi:MAG: 2-haloacid dehalogenase [Paracoccaceae bacterium]|jgi:2-haloacid dehalogenase